MTKILLFAHGMELGGAERALLGLLHNLDYHRVQVDLFLMRHRGEWMVQIPEEVHLLPEIPEYACLAVPISEVIRKGQVKVALGRLAGKLRAAHYVKKQGLKAENGVALEYSHKYTCRHMPQINDVTYDLAVSFLTPHYFVARNVHAKKKIAWIHTDYSFVDVDISSEEKMWDAYDQVVSISEACTKGFLSKFPGLGQKMIEIENLLPVNLVREQAELFEVGAEMPRDGSVRLLSVGRFCHAKNFDHVPEICRLLNQIVQSDASFGEKEVKWYLIGYGSDEFLIRRKIREAGMEGKVIILGKKDNPYPYMKECDLYVQPSRYEGNSVCVHEAQALGKAVVIANYATAVNQLKNGVDGVVVPQDNEGCAKGIAEVLRDKEKLDSLRYQCEKNDCVNHEALDAFYALLP